MNVAQWFQIIAQNLLLIETYISKVDNYLQ